MPGGGCMATSAMVLTGLTERWDRGLMVDAMGESNGCVCVCMRRDAEGCDVVCGGVWWCVVCACMQCDAG
eukprot:358783-Chlamydomonas_euryale.AAC.1